MKHIVIYPNWIPRVGGIESAVYNLAKLLDKKKYKVTIAVIGVESASVAFKYAEVADFIFLQPEDTIECDVCLIASNHQKPRNIIAKKFYQWIHSDYKKYKLQLRNKGEVNYISVSKHARNVAKEMFRVDSEVIYNILDPDFRQPPKKPLKLVSNTRLSPEKGFGKPESTGKGRMLRMVEDMNDKGIDFVWVVFGDNSVSPDYDKWVRKQFEYFDNVFFVGFKQDVRLGLQWADYLIQLSDFEGCPYTVLEALAYDLPCITTDYKGADELIQDGKNGYLIPMDLQDIDYDKIVSKIPVFKNKPLSSIKEWEDLFAR